MIAALAAAGSTISALVVIGLNLRKKKYCTVNAEAKTVFKIWDSNGTCPKDVAVYDLVYMSPLSTVGSLGSGASGSGTTGAGGLSFYAQSPESFAPNGFTINQSDDVPYFSNRLQNRYVTQVPSNSTTLSDNVRTWYSNSGLAQNVVNMCPQCFTYGSSATDTKLPFASAVSLPLFSNSEIGSRAATPGIQFGQTSGQSRIQIAQSSTTLGNAARDALRSAPLSLPATKFWVIPGDAVPAGSGSAGSAGNSGSGSGSATAEESGNPENYPINLNTGLTAGLSTILYFICLVDSCVYIDLGGARGGKFPLFSTNIDSQGNRFDISKFTGGNPGTIFGTLQVKKNDVLKVYLGSPGDSNVNTIPAFGGYGQGGEGTFLGGAFGGGASYITHYKYSVFGFNSLPGGSGSGSSNSSSSGSSNSSEGYEQVLEAALSPVSVPAPVLVCVAGGGGGSSRNASGGSAGFANESLTYGYPNVLNNQAVSRFGSTGGSLNVEGDAPINLNRSCNNLSGGGAVKTIGGQSCVTFPSKSCDGQKLVPFVPGGGGGTVYTDVGSGGGGGGGGYFGGGAGAYNDIAKPNNLHGAGGGGSSWNGTLDPVSADNITLNYYRNSITTPLEPSPDFYRNGKLGPNGTFLNDYGYIVFGTLYSR